MKGKRNRDDTDKALQAAVRGQRRLARLNSTRGVRQHREHRERRIPGDTPAVLATDHPTRWITALGWKLNKHSGYVESTIEKPWACFNELRLDDVEFLIATRIGRW